MTGRVDTAEGRKLQAKAKAAREFTRGQSIRTWEAWLDANADGLLAAAEERDTLREQNDGLYAAVQMAARGQDQLREALSEISRRGPVFDAKGTWSKRVCEIARTALAATGGQP